MIGDKIDPFDPGVVRATMGALFKQRIIRTTFKELQSWITTNKLEVVGASPNGHVEYDRTAYSSETILMLGNERSGLTRNEQSLCQQLVLEYRWFPAWIRSMSPSPAVYFFMRYLSHRGETQFVL